MTTSSKPGAHKKARIEIIPLIDIMFFLLASFMLVSMSMIKLQKIDTNLPASKTSGPQQKQDFVAVGIDSKGNYYFDKDKNSISIDQVPVRLQPFYDKAKDDTKVFVNCDSAASYDNLVVLLDAIRSIGITKINFAVKKDNHFTASTARPTTLPQPNAAPAAPAANP